MRPEDVSELLNSEGSKIKTEELFTTEDAGTSIYTAKIIDRVTISNEGDKQVTEIQFEVGRPVKRDRLDVG